MALRPGQGGGVHLRSFRRWGRTGRWPAFGRFVSQWRAGRCAATAQSPAPRFQWHGQRGEMNVDVLDRDERFINGLQLEASLTDPSRTGACRSSRSRRDATTASSRCLEPGATTSPSAGATAKRRWAPDLRSGGAVSPRSTSTWVWIGGCCATIARHHRGTRARAFAGQPQRRDRTCAAGTELAPQLWWPLFLAALLLLVAEVAVRKVPIPEALRSRWAGRRDASAERLNRVRSFTRAHRPGAGTSPRGDARWRSPQRDDPAMRARLYMAAGRARRADAGGQTRRAGPTRPLVPARRRHNPYGGGALLAGPTTRWRSGPPWICGVRFAGRGQARILRSRRA